MTMLLLEHGADVRRRDWIGKTALHYAVLFSDPDISRIIIEKGANIDEQDNLGHSVLHDAVYEGNLHQVQLLIDHGADLSIRTFSRNTLLHEAFLSGSKANCDIVKLLLERGANNCNELNSDQSKPFHLALKNGSLGMVKLLLNHGADVTKVDSKGLTSLHLAARNLQTDVIEFILEYGLDTESRSKYGDTALRYAAQSANSKGCKALLRSGAMVNYCQCAQSTTPLHEAVKIQDVATVQVLLEHGANVEARDSTGKSVVEIVAESKNEAIGGLLMRHMAHMAYTGWSINEADKQIVMKYRWLKQIYYDKVGKIRAAKVLSKVFNLNDAYHVVNQKLISYLSQDDLNFLEPFA